MTRDRTAIVLAARRMIHAAKVKRQWGDYACWPTAAYACTEFLDESSTDAQKDAAFRRLEEALTVITGLPKSTD